MPRTRFSAPKAYLFNNQAWADTPLLGDNAPGQAGRVETPAEPVVSMCLRRGQGGLLLNPMLPI